MSNLLKSNRNKRLVSVKGLILYAKCMVVSCTPSIQLTHYFISLIRRYVNGAATRLDFIKFQHESKFTDYLNRFKIK